MAGRQSGTVNWFNPEKAYGFISPDDGGKEIFFQISGVTEAGIGSLDEGQKVQFDVVEANGREVAINIVINS
jgi:CspA family cold shock protein